MNPATPGVPPRRLLDRPHALLLIVDVQEKLVPTIAEHAAVVRNIAILTRAAARLDVPQVVTLQNPQKLGDLVAPIAEHLRAPAVFTKMCFSAWREKLVEAHLKIAPRRQIVVTGIEAHVCVAQTALDLVDKGFQVFVPHDAVGSRSPANRDWALRRMNHNGVTITSTESVFFELLEQAGTAEFRELRTLIV